MFVPEIYWSLKPLNIIIVISMDKNANEIIDSIAPFPLHLYLIGHAYELSKSLIINCFHLKLNAAIEYL